jgi:hypothetical protein
MIKITIVMQTGFEPAIRGMRNSWNSWIKSDSLIGQCEVHSEKWYDEATYEAGIGPEDLALMKKLIKAGGEHRKFMRMITVWVDIDAPLYWWKQFDTYKVGVTANSCSTMHTIHDKPFEVDDFSFENVNPVDANDIVSTLNKIRRTFMETKDKKHWNAIIQMLPESYNQKRTVCLNYEVLYNIYHQRRGHKLKEWHEFCEFIQCLPYMEEFLKKKEVYDDYRE